MIGGMVRDERRAVAPTPTKATQAAPAPAAVSAVTRSKPSRAQVVQAIQLSDDVEVYQEVFTRAAMRLVEERGYSLEGIASDGGWTKSQAHRDQPIYFTHGGGNHRRDRVYLNAQTGELFQ
jgi:hypothetical protein